MILGCQCRSNVASAEWPPDLLRRERQVESADAERLERVHDRVRDGRRRADRARLADALDPERIARRRRHGAAEDVIGNVLEARGIA